MTSPGRNFAMDLTDVLFSPMWAAAGWAVAAALVAAALRAAPWRRFADSESVHVWYGAIFCVVVLWSLQATVGPGYRFHLLGMAAFTLLTGPALALVGGAAATGLLIAVRGGLWASAGLAWLGMVAVPVGVAWSVLRFSERRLPPNFFIYVFVATFLGAALSLGAGGLAGALALTAGAGLPADVIFGEYVPYLIYLAFGEATLTGMVITLAVVYLPRWVTTFDDARYLDGR
jgi:uncharacterized membrane protein